jgi:hypothetical protein
MSQQPLKFFCDEQRHLVCIPYSVDNLHQMARLLQIKRCWFHVDHYDIPKRRVEEIKKHCTIVPSKWIAMLVRGKRWSKIKLFEGMLYAIE